MRYLLNGFVTMTLIFVLSSGTGNCQIIEEVINRPTVDLGKGYKSIVSGITVNSALEAIVPDISEINQETEVIFDNLTELSSLQKTLGISVNASMKTLTFSGKASFALTQSMEYNTYHNYLLVKIEVRNTNTVLKSGVKLKKHALDLLKRKNYASFYDVYGDHYISEITTGGTFVGVIDIISESETMKKIINASIEASYGNYALDATFKNTLESVISKKNVKLYLLKRGGEVTTLPKIANLVDSAFAFPGSIKKGGRSVIGYKCVRYENDVENFPDEAKGKLDFEQERNKLSETNELFCRLLKIESDLKFADKNLFLFEEFDRNMFEKSSAKLNKAINDMRSTVISLAKNPFANKIPQSKIDTLQNLVNDLEREKPKMKELKQIPISYGAKFVNIGGKKAERVEIHAGTFYPSTNISAGEGTYRMVSFWCRFDPELEWMDIVYQGYIEDQGWSNPAKNGEVVEHKTNRNKRAQAIMMELQGPYAKYFDVVYEIKTFSRFSIPPGRNGRVVGEINGTDDDRIFFLDIRVNANPDKFNNTLK